MPFTSKAQQKFMFANHPRLAREMAQTMTKKQMKRLPKKVKHKK